MFHNRFLVPVSIVIALLGATQCSSSGSTTGPGQTPSTSLLDGTWKTTTMPSELFGARLKPGTIVASQGTYTATFDFADVGTVLGDGCTIATHQSLTHIAIDGASGTGTITDAQTASPGCSDPAATSSRVINLTIARKTARTPTQTPYDGDWTLTVTDPGGSQSVTVSVDGASWKMTDPANHDALIGQGTIAGAIATGTDGTADFAAQKQ
jgi:hypothetical protein